MLNKFSKRFLMKKNLAFTIIMYVDLVEVNLQHERKPLKNHIYKERFIAKHLNQSVLPNSSNLIFQYTVESYFVQKRRR